MYNQGEVASCKKSFNPPPTPVVYEAICFMSYLVLFSSCVFSPFSIAITSLGEEFWFCLWCLGRAAVCDCGTAWTFLLPFYVKMSYHSLLKAFSECSDSTLFDLSEKIFKL